MTMKPLAFARRGIRERNSTLKASIWMGARAFFTDIAAVRDHLHKVSFWETECDKVSTRLRTAIFRNEDLRLSHCMLLSDFVRHIEKISDRAEDVADRMNVYVIKRTL